MLSFSELGMKMSIIFTLVNVHKTARVRQFFLHVHKTSKFRSYLDTMDEDELGQLKSVHKTAKVQQFV